VTRSAIVLAAAIAALSCDKKKTDAVEIPEDLRGTYGRDDADAFFLTLGLEVDKDKLRFSEMTMDIVDAKLVGSTFQIDEAEVRWARQDRLPKKCKGTLARQGNRLLVSLFEQQTDAKCETALEGQWTAWRPVEALPESLRGTYGSGSIYSVFEGLKIGETKIELSGGSDPVVIDEAVMYEGRDDHVVLRRVTVGDTVCQGHVSVDDEGQLRAQLDLADPSEREGANPKWCPRLSGERWTIDTTQLPKSPIDNGKVRVEIRGETVSIAAVDGTGLRCEHAILRTGTRSSTDAGRDNIPVGSGHVLMLTRSAPKSGLDACNETLASLAANQCEELFGGPCDEGLLEGFHHDEHAAITCPSHIVIGDATTKGRKVTLLPPTIPNAVCFQMSGDFTGG
jgi:hypothetical protein